MPRNEFTLPEGTYFGFESNQEMFGKKLRACTRSIFCAGAGAEAKHHIAHRAKVSVVEVEKQTLPLQVTPNVQILNLGNYNLQGTGDAYRELIHESVLEIKDGHADTVKAF